ncbi:oligoendopeptidase F [Candidatus Acetothermia bacterium]|nr:oligoendopeptidase F [Candidatus Acetothermia bacterium]MBI3643798.1 oligoendopeptidase F [Candidatus Acetothermia bacterium]
MPTAIRTRNEIPVEHTWDSSSIYSSDEAWEREIAETEKLLKELSRFKGSLSKNPERLVEWFAASEDALKRVGMITTYATLHFTVDTSNPKAAAMNDRSRGLMARAMGAIAFAEPEMLELGTKKLQQWIKEEPRLKIYEHHFEKMESRRAHTRSGEVEELLSQVMDPFRTAASIHGTLNDADLRFQPAESSEKGTEPAEIIQGTIGKLLNSPDREIRRTAWEHYADAHLAIKNTMASCMATGIKQDVFLARARKYSSSLEAALTPNHIPLEVFHNLIQVFKKNLPTWHRYWAIRKQALGYKTFHVYDIKAPLTDQEKPISFDETFKWICEGMKPLGDDYVKAMSHGVQKERWVDIYPNKGKRSGAFSTGVPGTHPFIMMSYNDDIYGLSTLAHELGHSMHSYYSRKTQPFVYARYTLFVAEVASNFNQALVRDYLLSEKKDRDFQISVIEEAMSNFHRYFFIMPTLARFELEIHERVERGEALTAESLIKLMANLFREGYGHGVEMDEERVGITWAQFATHLYSNFYVYQYATGIAGAHALANRVLKEGQRAANDYLEFLRAGDSLYPIDALKRAGVDLSKPAPVEEAFGVLAEYVNRLESLLQ